MSSAEDRPKIPRIGRRGGIAWSHRAVDPMVASVPRRPRCQGSSTRYAGGQGAVPDNARTSEKRLSIGSTALSARWRRGGEKPGARSLGVRTSNNVERSLYSPFIATFTFQVGDAFMTSGSRDARSHAQRSVAE